MKQKTSLPEAKINSLLKKLSGWKIEEKKTRVLAKQFKFKNFVEAVKFVDELALLAENIKHHPDITISYNKVFLSTTTHDANGLTEKDFALAEKIEGLIS